MTTRKAEILIATVYIAWGSSYLLMKLGLGRIEPFNLIALRFGIAFLLAAFIFRRRLKTDWATLRKSMVLGCLIFLIFSLIMIGLKTTTATSAGFLASTAVLAVPIMQAVIRRKIPPKHVMAGVIIAMLGVALLTIKDDFVIEAGAMLCAAGAMCYAVHIIITKHFVATADALQLGIYQLGFAALCGLAFSLVFERPTLPAAGPEWVSVLGLALVCSAYGFVAQVIAQQYTTPERVGVLFALEPLFSAVFSFVLLREILPAKAYAGAVFVLLSILITNDAVVGKIQRRKEGMETAGLPSSPQV